MAQSVYIVAYDIISDKRRTRIYKYLRGWGDHLQYSVFRVLASPIELAKIKAALDTFVNHDEDQVLFFHLGPKEGRARGSVDAIGLAYTHPERHALIV